MGNDMFISTRIPTIVPPPSKVLPWRIRCRSLDLLGPFFEKVRVRDVCGESESFKWLETGLE